MGIRVVLAAVVALVSAPALAQSNDLPKQPWPSISLGQVVNGTLSASDFKRPDGTLADVFSYQARAGETVTITMRAPAFDAWLVVDDPNGPMREYDDDSAGGTDSKLTVTFPHDGVFAIVANAVSGSATGSYTLVVSRSQGASTPAPSSTTSTAANDDFYTGHSWPTIAAGQTISGRLATSDYKRHDNTYADGFMYQARAGEKVTITLRSSDFDAWLVVDDPNGPYQGYDDDSAGGQDSRLEVTFDHAGPYLILANSVSANATGSYTLSVASSGASPSSGSKKQVNQ